MQNLSDEFKGPNRKTLKTQTLFYTLRRMLPRHSLGAAEPQLLVRCPLACMAAEEQREQRLQCVALRRSALMAVAQYGVGPYAKQVRGGPESCHTSAIARSAPCMFAWYVQNIGRDTKI